MAVLVVGLLSGLFVDVASVGAETPEDSWMSELSDEDIRQLTRKSVDDVYEKFFPELEGSDESVVEERQSAPIRIHDRGTARLGDRRLLVATLKSDYATPNAEPQCKLTVVVDRTEDEGPHVMASEPFCAGGSTGQRLTNRRVQLTADIPLLVVRSSSAIQVTPKWASSNAYILYRVDRGRFEKVLEVPFAKAYQKSEVTKCTRPQLASIDVDTHVTVPGAGDLDASPHMLTATVLCGGDEAYIRVWRWRGDAFEEMSVETPETYPPQLGGPYPRNRSSDENADETKSDGGRDK